jgi:hypothetical protein
VIKARTQLLVSVANLLLVCAFVSFANCQHKGAPQIRPRRASQTGERGVVKLKSGENLQNAVNAAEFGDRIILEAGAAYGPLILPYKPDKSHADYITIETENVSAIAKEGERVRPAEHAGAMAKILSPGGKPALTTAPQAHHYRFIGIEFAPVVNSEYLYNLIDLGAPDYNSTSQLPHHLIFDRCYVHSTGLNKARRGFALNSAETSIVNSHVSGFAGAGDETQAIAGWNGPGPVHILNNFLEGGGEVILFGGSDPSIPNLVPSDIEIRRNYLYKPTEWQGRAAIKGTFELKNARRVVVEGNVIDSRILTTAMVITVRNQNGKAPWSTIEDVEIRNNVVRHASSGFNILGSDNEHSSQTARNIRISNNLLLDIMPDSPNNTAYFLQINGGERISVEHNTVEQSGNIITSYGQPTRNFVFNDNIVQHSLYGIVCVVESTACKRESPFCRCFPEGTIKGNVIADNANVVSNDPSIPGRYPSGNFFVSSYDKLGFADYSRGDWRLATNSKYRGRATDGGDPGVNFTLLKSAGIESIHIGNK